MTRPFPTLESLGAGSMGPEELSALAVHLRWLAVDLETLRFLRLERRLRYHADIPNRPTIGYYLQLATATHSRSAATREPGASTPSEDVSQAEPLPTTTAPGSARRDRTEVPAP
jgi:hypothetical protein